VLIECQGSAVEVAESVSGLMNGAPRGRLSGGRRHILSGSVSEWLVSGLLRAQLGQRVPGECCSLSCLGSGLVWG